MHVSLVIKCIVHSNKLMGDMELYEKGINVKFHSHPRWNNSSVDRGRGKGTSWELALYYSHKGHLARATGC